MIGIERISRFIKSNHTVGCRKLIATLTTEKELHWIGKKSLQLVRWSVPEPFCVVYAICTQQKNIAGMPVKTAEGSRKLVLQPGFVTMDGIC